jgi:hypothetical protein
MTEPLDADTLAEGERLRHNAEGWGIGLDASRASHHPWSHWLDENADALLAVARDHARLTAENETLFARACTAEYLEASGLEKLAECEQALALYEAENAKMTEELARVQEVRDALAALDGLPTGTPPLSAEAGDQGTWMGGGLEITYPSAEAGDTDA